MRYLFLSGVHTGGAPLSTIELAQRLSGNGHDVTVLLGDLPPENSPFDLAVRAWVKAQAFPPAAAAIKAAARRFGKKVEPALDRSEHVPVLRSKVPQNAYLGLLDQQQPDLVIVNSMPRAALKWIAQDLQDRRIPLVLYLREAHAVTHITVSGLRPDVLVANAQQFADQLAAVDIACQFIPSVVDCSHAKTETNRTTALFINPVPENNPDLLLTLAAARPDIPFVFQESWPLRQPELERLMAKVNKLDNVEFRPRTDTPAHIYRDARVLLANYPGGRPRVVLEAQTNGIPVLGQDQPALAEAVGPGGVLLNAELPASAWLEQLSLMWDNPQHYATLVANSIAHAARPEITPDHLTERFEQLTRDVVARGTTSS